MNNDAISRSAVLETLCNGCNSRNNTPVPRCGDMCADFKEVLKLPALDVAPVVHAYWTKQGNDIVCSGKDGCYEAMRWIEYIARDYFDGKLPEHCPHCGARMDGDAE